MFLNDWGSLDPAGSFDGDSAKALLETGKVALIYLTPILDNGEKAPFFGSKEATMSKVYGYRRKDFAYRYVSVILGDSPTFQSDPKQRDKDIGKLRAKLKRDAKRGD